MGVSYTENCISCPNKQVQSRNISEVNITAIYRSDEIYKDCSYQLPSVNVFKTKKQKIVTNSVLQPQDMNRELPRNNQNLYTQYYWSKVHQPLATERQSKDRPVAHSIRRHSYDSRIDTPQYEKHEIIPNRCYGYPISTENVGTSVASFLKSGPSLSSKVKAWYKITFPKLTCPCCTGGSDGGAPYNAQSIGGSYESIDLRARSDNALHSLNLDPSLMSIIHLHRSMRTKRTPKLYAKILRGLVCNTYKNAVCLIHSVK
ncbi:unnamed protein product [Chrysodeixis includens]|uniref:Uncharacterized protein n=1 Tax=Chrysodeixis includens TaxID=689277 RepID=A0A9N8KX74_CHRIL|nr:unnamed protein product [Chrysodeixis includens]